MPTHYTLTASTTDIEASCAGVAQIARKSEAEDVDTNTGIRTTAELIDRATKGNSISFNYDRLINEAGSYE